MCCRDRFYVRHNDFFSLLIFERIKIYSFGKDQSKISKFSKGLKSNKESVATRDKIVLYLWW